MPTESSKGKGNALAVLIGEKFAQVPLHNAEAILSPSEKIQTWIKSRMRTGGEGDVLPGGEIKYYAYPKQAQTQRDIEITIDNTTGKVNGGFLGAETDANFGYVKPTIGQRIVEDTVKFQSATFLKHVFMKKDLKEKGLTNLINKFVQDNLADKLELNMKKLKEDWRDTFGTVGKWATDEGYTAPGAGVGLRLRAKTYTKDVAGAEEAIKDIQAVVSYKMKLGLKDGTEPTYPFTRGMDASKNTLISISSDINSGICKKLENSTSGFISGVTFNKETQIVTHIRVDGISIPVEIQTDVPQKGGKNFNWAVEEVGKRGAIAMPNKFSMDSTLVPNYAGMSMLSKIFEMIGLVLGFKALQPELNWGSWEA